MKLSAFGRKFTRNSGILRLMDDLGSAISAGSGKMLMLGGGNPAHIPEVQKYFRTRMESILANGKEFEQTIGDYDGPQGENGFIEVLAELLRKEYGWKIGPENIALTNGSQTAFFFLFNMFAGKGSYGGSRIRRKILFPLAPEYIGYADMGLSDDFFAARKPGIEMLGSQIFKYHVDFSNLKVSGEIGAICVSRPTNPTGNVLTDDEIMNLSDIAGSHDIPLIIDNAYGTPFPNIIFTDAKPIWNENIVMCMSLSKLGLPGLRTGIVIANRKIISSISAMNAIFSLAPGGFGVSLAYDIVASGKIISISRDIIRPFYQAKAETAVSHIQREFKDCGCCIHKPEGALFLWLWFKGLPISSMELYERLKKRGVLIVPGNYFFPGMDGSWKHRNECIRLTYAQDDGVVRKGISIMADEVRKIRRTGNKSR
ncbi:MAG TPA: valine--pyruvate transaminase [Lentisphaeria bacterium]|nr:MAG: valine--pyruvate transaminase [Lentisphaerae bacterium GWF2_50_93]HCE46367.1 valine--pyruvate transaminase [Lentisphaeria bacterium]